MRFDKVLLEEKAAILKLISHPVRLCILRGLSEEGENNVSYIQGCLDIPQSTLSQHLAKLRLSGVVKDERRGTEVYYSLADDEVKRIIDLLFKSEEE
ncbi:MAG: ArsR/SmtB family transcription factor [Bacillota bacterium]